MIIPNFASHYENNAEYPAAEILRRRGSTITTLLYTKKVSRRGKPIHDDTLGT